MLLLEVIAGHEHALVTDALHEVANFGEGLADKADEGIHGDEAVQRPKWRHAQAGMPGGFQPVWLGRDGDRGFRSECGVHGVGNEVLIE